MLDLLYILTFYGILFGILMMVYDNLRHKAWTQALALIFIPFYAIAYVLKLDETHPYKKSATILVLGGFVLFFFVSILKLLFASPV